MKILHVVTGLRKASGVTTFVENVADELRRQGHFVEVVTKNTASAQQDKSLDAYDLIHIHGLWDPWLHKWARKASQDGVKMVWSPHGMLQKWALKNKWLKKFAALALYQWRDLNAATLLHATAQSEIEDIHRLGLKNKIVKVPLGVRIPQTCPQKNKQTIGSNIRIILFASRVQRKKGLPNLIEAWSRLSESSRQNWQIRIVGPDQDKHTFELKIQCNQLGIAWHDCLAQSNNRTIEQSDIVFVGPKYDADLSAEYDNADLFVLPTHSENFGSVVIEALAHGVPVITTKEAPWAELEEFQCGWWIDDNVDALAEALQEACDTVGLRALPEKGFRGRKLVEERYTWSAVCDIMVRGYKDVLK